MTCPLPPADPSIGVGDTLVYDAGCMLRIVTATFGSGRLELRYLTPEEAAIAKERLREHADCHPRSHRQLEDGDGHLCTRFVFAYGTMPT